MENHKLSRRLRRIAAPLAAGAVTIGLAVGWMSSQAQLLPNEAGSGPLVHQQSIILQVQPDGLGSALAVCTSTSLGQAPCLAAVFTVGHNTFQNLDYSTKACSGDPSQQGFLNDPCTAAPFLTSSQSLAVKNFPGASCDIEVKGENAPSSTVGGGDCRVDMFLTSTAGGFNASGVCLASYFLTGSCTAAVVSTTDHSIQGGDRLDITNEQCPVEGDIESSCTAPAFQYLNSELVVPHGATQPVAAPTPTPTAFPTPTQQPIAENNAAFLVLTPDPQYSYFQPGACAATGKPDVRCVIALLKVKATPSNLVYSDHVCKASLSSGNSACTAPAYREQSSGDIAVHNYPGSTCVNAAGSAVPCEMYVVEQPYYGEFVPPAQCTAVASISAPCTVADFDITHASGNDTVHVSSTICPSDNHFTGSCVSTPFLGVPLEYSLPQSY